MTIPLPQWFDSLTVEEQERVRTKLIIKLAAIYASPEMTVQELSSLVGYSSNTLGQLSSSRQTISPSLCVKLEEACGRSYLPREVMNPHIFEVPSEQE